MEIGLKPRDVEWRLFTCEQLLEGERWKRLVAEAEHKCSTSRSDNHRDVPSMFLRSQPNLS